MSSFRTLFLASLDGMMIAKKEEVMEGIYRAETKQRRSTDWADIGVSLFERLTERKAHIVYQFENLMLSIPEKAESNSKHAKWELNGTLRIHTHVEK